MKKLFTTLVLVAGIAVSSYAQHCSATSTSVSPRVGSAPGLTPTPDSLDCTVVGSVVSDTIYFKNFTAFSGFNVNSLTIDSIGNLPAGLCWVSNKANNTFAGGEDGIILVSGTCTGAPGQYKLKIIISASIQTIGNINSQDAEALANLRYYVRVKSANNCCFKLDTTLGKTQSFIAESALTTGCTTLGVAEISNEISGLSVQPNPFTTSASVRFNAENEASYSVKMMNLLGATVMTKEIKAVRGENDINIDRNNLNAGIYLISVSNGKSSITKKVIIE